MKAVFKDISNFSNGFPFICPTDPAQWKDAMNMLFGPVLFGKIAEQQGRDLGGIYHRLSGRGHKTSIACTKERIYKLDSGKDEI